MPMSHGGLTKLLEELCELGQVAAKKIAYPDTDNHPDGAGSLKERMEAEIGDVWAIIQFVIIKYELDMQAIYNRLGYKLGMYQAWDKEEDLCEMEGGGSEFTQTEMQAIKDGLDVLVLDGLVDSDDHPIVTAYQKVKVRLKFDAG